MERKRIMHNLFNSAAKLLFAALFSLPTIAAETIVNGVAIPEAAAELAVAEQKAKGVPDTQQLREAVRNELIGRELLTQEARKLGLDKKTEVATQVEIARQAVYINAFVQEFSKTNPITDLDVRAAYDNLKAQLGDTEYKIRHILVEQESEANAIIVNLKKGAKFDDLAKQSKDRASAERGGDLGWINRVGLVKPLIDAIVGMSKGKYTETPIRTNVGYHVVLLEDTRPLSLPPLDQMRQQLAQRLLQEKIQRYVSELRAKATIQ